jgi:hypothetical protein
MIDYSQILLNNYPNTQWILAGNSYENLDWHDVAPKPTQAELDALWESTQVAIAAQEQIKIDTKVSALAKLAALGLTQDEVKALLG